jgi:hypothetical protein
MWQEVCVVLVVSGAVCYLVRKLLGTGPRPKAPTTFVPLSQLRRRR